MRSLIAFVLLLAAPAAAQVPGYAPPGTVTLASPVAVTQSGGWTVNLGAGTATIGAVTQSGGWTVSLGAGSAAIGSVGISNWPSTQPVSGTVSLGAGSAAIGSVSVSNFPATQPVSAAALPLPAGAATAANQTPPVAPGTSGGAATPVQGVTGGVPVPVTTTVRSGSWADASVTATSTAATAVAAAASRTGLHVWNLGSALACLNFGGTAALSGSACAAGSIPVPAGGAYFEDQPGNVSPDLVSVVAVSSTNLTIKVR